MLLAVRRSPAMRSARCQRCRSQGARVCDMLATLPRSRAMMARHAWLRPNRCLPSEDVMNTETTHPNRIVVGLDFTDTGDRALREAVALVKQIPNSELHVAHALDLGRG